MSKANQAIKVALHGMDKRAYKTMEMYLEGPCNGIARIADEFKAMIDIIDADHVTVKALLEERKSKTPDRPIIILSLEALSLEGTIFVQKPVQRANFLAAIKKAYLINAQNQAKKVEATPTAIHKQKSETERISSSGVANESLSTIQKAQAIVEKESKKVLDTEEQKKTSKHQTSKRLNEGGFSAYIGHVEGVDFSSIEKAMLAVYNPKNYFLGYVQSAVNMAKAKSQVLQLKSGWKPLIVFPQSHEIWLDADDRQLRAFAGFVIKNNSNQGMSLMPVNQETLTVNKKMENFYDTSAFLWKLAIWTSKGRYPYGIDIHRPVFLKRWPNFTRLLITPHALRISALMIEGPRTLINIAQSLNIKPQYVFIFISAASAVGLVDQATRRADEMIAPPVVKKPKRKGLLSRILGKLRGS